MNKNVINKHKCKYEKYTYTIYILHFHTGCTLFEKMSNHVNTNCTVVANDINGYSLATTRGTGRLGRVTEPEVDTTLCGRDGSLRERRCQLFKLTMLAILPGIIIIVRDALKVASDVQVFYFCVILFMHYFGNDTVVVHLLGSLAYKTVPYVKRVAQHDIAFNPFICRSLSCVTLLLSSLCIIQVYVIDNGYD